MFSERRSQLWRYHQAKNVPLHPCKKQTKKQNNKVYWYSFHFNNFLCYYSQYFYLNFWLDWHRHMHVFCSAQYHLIIQHDVMSSTRTNPSLILDGSLEGRQEPFFFFFKSLSCPLIFSFSVITNTEEWGYFKTLTKTPTQLEENMFHLEEGTPGPRVYLRPKESIHIPLKYQSFLCDHTMALQVQYGTEVDAMTVRNGRFRNTWCGFHKCSSWKTLDFLCTTAHHCTFSSL